MAPVFQNVINLCTDALIKNVSCVSENVSDEENNQEFDYEQLNLTSTTPIYNNNEEEEMRKLTEFHIIKAVVLSAVTLVILLSICKMVFGMILKYPGGKNNT